MKGYKLIITAAVLVLVGCKTIALQEHGQKDPAFLRPATLSPEEEIRSLEAKSDKDKSGMIRLVYLYSGPSTEKPDIEKAQKVLREYQSQDLDGDEKALAEYLGHLLNTLKAQSDLAVRAGIRQKKAEKKARKLEQQVKKLETKLMNLKNLDIRLEKQRLGSE